MLKLLGSYSDALHNARGNGAKETLTLAAPAIVILLTVAIVAGVLG